MASHVSRLEGGGDIVTVTTYNSAAKQGAPHMRRPAETPAAA